MSPAKRPFLKSTIATLCVALSLVFVGASAAGVVNRFQHDLRLEHAHDQDAGAQTFIDAHEGDGLGGGLADDTVGRDGGAEPGDNPGGHHHADGPAGFLAAEVDAASEAITRNLQLSGGSDRLTRGWPPKGPERPPRHFATSA